MQFVNPQWFDRLRSLSEQYRRLATSTIITQTHVDVVRRIFDIDDGEMGLYRKVLREADKLIDFVRKDFTTSVGALELDAGINPLPVRVPCPRRKVWSTEAVEGAVRIACAIQLDQVAHGKKPLLHDDLMLLVERKLEDEGLRGGNTVKLTFIAAPEPYVETDEEPNFSMGV